LIDKLIIKMILLKYPKI